MFKKATVLVICGTLKRGLSVWLAFFNIPPYNLSNFRVNWLYFFRGCALLKVKEQWRAIRDNLFLWKHPTKACWTYLTFHLFCSIWLIVMQSAKVNAYRPFYALGEICLAFLKWYPVHRFPTWSECLSMKELYYHQS